MFHMRQSYYNDFLTPHILSDYQFIKAYKHLQKAEKQICTWPNAIAMFQKIHKLSQFFVNIILFLKFIANFLFKGTLQ